MNNLCGILKSPNNLSMLNSNNYIVGRQPSSKSNEEARYIFTVINFLKYCRLILGPKQPEKLKGLSLVSIIANEPRFKEGIIRRCELTLRTRSIKRKQHFQTFMKKDDNIIPEPILRGVLERKPDVKPELIPIKCKESVTSLHPMLVNDIKSFALLDAKFRENEERNLLHETLYIWNEEFIRDINPTYSDAKIDGCIIDKQPDEEEQQSVSEQVSKISTVLNDEKTTEVIMSPRSSNANKKDVEFDDEEVAEKKPVLSKLKLMKPGTDVFKQEKSRGWRIKKSFEIYKAKQEKHASGGLSRASQCASEVATSRQVDLCHPLVKAVTSTRLLPDVYDVSTESLRRRKEAEKRIRASFDAFVARQSQARLNRNQKEQ